LTDLAEAENLACRIKNLTGALLEYKFNAGRRNIVTLPALVMPASNVLLGHYLPVKNGNKIIYDRIIG